MILLQACEITKRYGTRPLCEQVSFELQAGEHVGLIGANGSGKSTLLKVLAGIEEADGGSVTLAARTRLRYLAQEVELPSTSTVSELLRSTWAERAEIEEELRAAHDALAHAHDETEISRLLARQSKLESRLESLGGYRIEHEIEAISEHLALPPGDVPAGALSGGERRRVALACALLERPDVLLLDEPTNHLDTEAIEWFEEHMQSFPGAFLLVTHDRYLLDGTVSRLLELDRGVLRSYEGGYQDYLDQRAQRLAEEARTEANRKAFLRRELYWIRRGPKARTTKAKARVDRFDRAVADRPEPLPKDVQLAIPPGPRLGQRVLSAKGLRVVRGGRELVKDLDFVLENGDRVGIVGRNGCGKTSLIDVFLGRVPPDGGEVSLGPTVQLAALPQGGENLDLDATLMDNVSDRADQVEHGGSPQSVHGFLEQLGFASELHDRALHVLSGGERRRVQLAKVLRQRGNVLVLDEPTNDLDLPTLRVLEESLAEFPGCLVLVTHDRFFLDRVATRILAFEEDGRIVVHPGSFSDYREHRARRAEPATQQPAKPARQAPAAKTKRLTWAEQRELEALPARIEELEGRVREHEAALADPTLYSTASDGNVRRLTEEYARLRNELEATYLRWTELEERVT